MERLSALKDGFVECPHRWAYGFSSLIVPAIAWVLIDFEPAALLPLFFCTVSIWAMQIRSFWQGKLEAIREYL